MITLKNSSDEVTLLSDILLLLAYSYSNFIYTQCLCENSIIKYKTVCSQIQGISPGSIGDWIVRTVDMAIDRLIVNLGTERYNLKLTTDLNH